MTDHRRTRTPGHTPTGERPAQRQAWTIADIQALGVTTDVVTAGQILGLSRNTTYRLARANAFPVPVIKAGNQYRIPVAALLTALNLDPAASGQDGTAHDNPPRP